MTETDFSPKEFLRERRPEKFSDSRIIREHAIDRSQLEYHLSVLTSKKQEIAFEDFARELAQREICPNLLPQTGPTGGGDSKVDSETYPVANALALSWYSGIGREASEDRWAFAFSAKERWRPKLRSDVDKIAKTGRGYTKAFFVSNQFVKDKARADLEDELREEHGLDVRLLDRNWILDRVFSGEHLDLVSSCLGLGERKDTRQTGPRDMARREDLDATEEWLQESLARGDRDPGIVNKAIDALRLSRGLEEAEYLIRGRAERARRLADEFGTVFQRIESRYQASWTAFWWLEDPGAVPKLYSEMESLVAGTLNAHELELLCNLWFLLLGSNARGELDDESANLSDRAKRLTAELERLEAEEGRPSASLLARTLKLQLALSLAEDEQERARIVENLQDVVDQSAGLVGFPLQSLVDVVLELSGLLESTPGFDALFDRVVDVSAARSGEVEAAQILVGRAAKQLDSQRSMRAVATVGRALKSLYKHESRDVMVRALFLAGVAYQRLGLLWAARGAMVNAASIATHDLWTYGRVTNAQVAGYEKLRWLELELGRLPHLLEWHVTTMASSSAAGDAGRLTSTIEERNLHFDAVVGMLFLQMDMRTLTRVDRLPDVLDSVGLVNASVALRWALSASYLPSDFEPVVADLADPAEYFSMWLDQPAAGAVRKTVDLGLTRKTTLNSWLLGCNVIVESEVQGPALRLSESILAALEALLATGPMHRAVAREPRINVRVSVSEFTDPPFSFDMRDESGRPRVVVRTTPFDSTSATLEEQTRIKEKLLDLLLAIMGRIVVSNAPESMAEQMFGGEDAVGRAVDFTGSLITLSNVLGDTPRFDIDAWQGEDEQRYPLQRDEPWNGTKSSTAASREESQLAEGPAPDGVFDPARMSHRRMRTMSLIRESLWDEAGWKGVLYTWRPDIAEPPILAPVFTDGEVAVKIFQGLRDELGAVDDKEQLRICIVRGIDRGNPHAYRVTIGSDPLSFPEDLGAGEEASLVVAVVRIHTMHPEDAKNLDGFLERYEKVGSYRLAPAAFASNGEAPRVASKLAIVKRELVVKDAWMVGLNDPDSVAIRQDDDPIIPDDTEDAPVLELLEAKRESG